MIVDTTRIYVVTSGDRKRLVRATNASQAFAHVARDLIDVKVANQSTLVELLGLGVAIERARPESPSAQNTTQPQDSAP